MPTTERGTHHIFPKPFVKFIGLIGSSIHDSIIFEWKNSKYVTISLDSTPDSKRRPVDFNRTLCFTSWAKRFIKFLDMDSHNAEHLQDKLLAFLNENGIGIENCRGQSYDNASKMSGRYNGFASAN